MAVFRVERNTGYTVMSNHHLRNTDDMRKCIVCGASFASKSNSVKYCPDCRKRITRRQAAERMRKKRTLVTQ